MFSNALQPHYELKLCMRHIISPSMTTKCCLKLCIARYMSPIYQGYIALGELLGVEDGFLIFISIGLPSNILLHLLNSQLFPFIVD